MGVELRSGGGGSLQDQISGPEQERSPRSTKVLVAVEVDLGATGERACHSLGGF